MSSRWRIAVNRGRRPVLDALFFAAWIFSLSLSAAARHDFQAGKLVNIDSDERLIEGTTYRWAVFTVQIGDVVYTARGERLRRRAGDPGHGLVIGDSVQVAIDGESLVMLKPDGKELRAKIVKRARAH
jgi:hypothetical protein